MKFGLMLGAAALMSLSAMPAASAAGWGAGGIEWGAPDFPNYMSRIGAVSCDWDYDNYFRACPNPETPPKAPKEAPKGPTTAKNPT